MSRGPLLPFSIAVVPRSDTMTPRAGLPLVVETLRALGMPAVLNRDVTIGERSSPYSSSHKLEALMLLLAAGGEAIDDIETLRADAGLCRLLGGGLPAASTLRTFLYEFHDDGLIEAAKADRPPDAVAYIPAENDALRGLARSRTELVRRVQQKRFCRTATIDYDATIQESHKKEALPHHKGGRGYQPVLAVWAEQDLVVADQYRDGNVPAGMENLPLIKEAFGNLPSGIADYRFRSDSAAYEDEVLDWLLDEDRQGGPKGKIEFSISADMSVPLRKLCEDVPAAEWALVEERPDETVTCADVEFLTVEGSKNAPPRRYVAIRIEKTQGLLFSSGYDTKYLAVVTNRWEMSGPELMAWHWGKAGTVEHVHDVTKNDLGAAVPPCGRFGANAAWYRLSGITYNVLSVMKALAFEKGLAKARPKRLRFSIFSVAGKIVSHGRRLILYISEAAERTAGLLAARERLAALARQAAVPRPAS